MKHPQYELLLAIANGEQMQSTQFLQGFFEGAIYKDCDPSVALHILSSESDQNLARLRIKPRTIMIGDVEVPEPMRVAPDYETPVWISDTTQDNPRCMAWVNSALQNKWLRNGLLHDAEDSAIQQTAALVKQLGGVL